MAIAGSKDIIGTTQRPKGWKFADDFHPAYFQSIVQNILGLILSRVKDQLKKTGDNFATKSVFNETFPTLRDCTFADDEVVKVVEEFFNDDIMNTLIKEKMVYQNDTFGAGSGTKRYKISKEFTEAIKKLLSFKVIYYTNGILLISAGVLSEADIKKYSEISGTNEQLIEGITGAFCRNERRVYGSRAKSPSRRGRSPKRKGISPKIKQSIPENNKHPQIQIKT